MKVTSLQFIFLFLQSQLNNNDNEVPSSLRWPCNQRLQLSSERHSNENGIRPLCSENMPFISSIGKTANFMLYWPSITTFTLVSGWNDTSTERLKYAVNKVVENNKVLTGTASKDGFLNNVKIIITPGLYTQDSHNFTNIVRVRKDKPIPDFANMCKSEILAFMDKVVTPMVPKAESVIESVSKMSPLFGVDLICLGNEYACYVVKMSHCVGDGVTYFKIMDQINHYFNHNETKKYLHPIDWTNDAIPYHEIFPATFSNRDIQIMYGIPFLLGLLRNTWNIRKQKKGYFILSKRKIEKKKKYYINLLQRNVSTNDIITTALCEANLSSDIFAFTMNMRRFHCNYGGNYHTEIPFLKSSVLSLAENKADPASFRNILRKGCYYDTDKIPVCPFILGKVGRISSLSTIQKLIFNHEIEIICHAMLSSFVSNVPMDTAFISSMDNETYVVLHNFREIRMYGLLDEISF